MLCYGTRIVCHTDKGDYDFIIIKCINQISKLITNYQDKPQKNTKKSKKHVNFCETPEIYYVPSKYEEDRSIGFEIPRGLKIKWVECQKTIFNIINETLSHKIEFRSSQLSLSANNHNIQNSQNSQNDEEPPLKITTLCEDKGWWEDCSPMELLNDITTGKIDLGVLTSQIDELIGKTQDCLNTKPLHTDFANYSIDIDIYQYNEL